MNTLTDSLRQSPGRLAVLLLVFLVAAQPVLAQRTPLEPGFNLYSPEDDVAIGRKFIAETEPELDIIDDTILAEYVNRLGQQLATEAPGFEYPYTFKLVNDTAINAFALPGGPVYLNRGIIEAADREAEVAGVLAHEIAHVALRHGTNQASKSSLVSAPLSILGGIFGGGGGVASILTQVGIGFGANALFLRYSRDAERQADLMGAQILFDAGYDPTGMPEFFEKLAAESGGRGSEFFSSHPDPGNRASNVSEEIARFGAAPPRYTDNFSDFRRVKDRLADLPEPSEGDRNGGRTQTPDDDRRTGPPEQPSPRYQQYRDSTLQFVYPSNWSAQGGNGSVTLAPAGGVMANGALAYGMLISTFEPTPNRTGRISLEDATDQLIASLRESNPELQVGQGYRRVRVDRRDALSVGLAMNSPVGGVERDWLLTTFGPDQTFFFFVGAAPRPEFPNYQAAYQRIFESVDFR